MVDEDRWPAGGIPLVPGVQPLAFAPVTKEILAEVVRCIVSALRPAKVILFRSYVWGTPTSDSDVDLLVITETNARPADRYVAVARLIRGRYASKARTHAGLSQGQVLLPPEDAEEAQLQTRQGRPSKPQQPIFLPHESEGRRYYSVDEVRRTLETEADVDAWVPERATVYRWINAKKIPVTLDAQGRKWLNDEGVQLVRVLVMEQRARKALKD